MLLLLTVNAVVHLPGLTDPPLSRHAWRQAGTADIARNYLEIDPGFLRPRLDYLYNGTGITLGDLALYNYLVWSVHEVVALALTVVCARVALAALFAAICTVNCGSVTLDPADAVGPRSLVRERSGRSPVRSSGLPRMRRE